MISVKRSRILAKSIIAVVAVGVLAGCGPDAASVPTTLTTPPVATSVGSTVPADFGATYLGQPVAFWFWAPY